MVKAEDRPRIQAVALEITLKHLRIIPFISLIAFCLFVGSTDTALAQGTTVAPMQLTFTGQQGMASSIGAQTVTVTATDGPVSFAVGNVPSWLTVSPISGVAGSSGFQLVVAVNATANSFPATVTMGSFTINSTGNPASTVNVTLNLTGGGASSTLTANPNPVVFNAPVGNTQVNQSLSVATTGASVTVNASTMTTSGGNWLGAFPGTATINPGTPLTINVTANPAGLLAGSYSGSVTITPQTGTALVIPVMLNVGTAAGAALTVTPSPFPNITIPAGSTTPVNQTLTVSTTSSSVTFTASASTVTGGNWLSVNPPGNITVMPATPVMLTVSINPTGLAANTYSGSIVLTPQGGGTPVTIPVSVVISGSPAITATPSQFSFAYQTGTAFPPAQTLTIGSNGSAISFGVTASTQMGGNWLVVSPQNGGTSAAGPPAVVSVQINPSGLAPGTYLGQVSVLANGASNSPVAIPVTLVVSNQPILMLGNSGTTFTYQLGTPLPAAQTVQLNSSGNPLTFAVTTTPVSGGAFLNVSPTGGTTPQALSFTLNQAVIAGLGPGTYTETVTVTSATAGNSPQNYTVTLIVSNSTLLVPSQNALSFNYQIGQSQPVIQTVGVSSTGAPLTYAVSSTSSNCGNFLSATPANGSTMTGNVAVAVNTTGLAAGTCTGVVTLSSPNAGNTVSVPVTLYVSNTPLLTASPSAINLTTQIGTSPANQIISLTSTDPATALPFNVTSSTINGGNWLLVGPTSGSTPANLTIGFTTSGLPVGTYNGTITITSAGPANAPVMIPVTVVIAPSATASPMPAALTFNQAFNGPAPATQTIQLTSTTPGLNYTAAATTFSGGNWLSVTPATGLTPGSSTVTANGSTLAQGSYSGVITFVVQGAANSPVNVPVTLIVGPSQSLAVSTNTIPFTFQAGSLTIPTAQNIQVTSTGGNVPYTTSVSTSNGVNFLTVSPASGNTPGPVSVGLNQQALATLAAGTYTGTVTISSPNLPAQIVNVTVTVTAAAPPSIMSIVNAASNQPGAVSPGEIVTIYGMGIGPVPSLGVALTPQGAVSTNLGNTVVTFDGIPAPLIFVSSGQINAIVPYEIAGRVNTSVIIQRNGLTSPALQLRVVDTAPAIFSASQGGSGQGAILNFDFSVNSAANPAPKKSVIQIFGTGEGALTPAAQTGSVTSATGPTFPNLVANVAVTVGGQPAQVLYAGEAPGLVSGVLQVNVVVPDNIGNGPQTIVLTVGGANNMQQTISVAVQ